MDYQRLPFLLAIVAGAGVWGIVSVFTGKAEAWDHSAYWWGAYPTLFVASSLLGWTFPERAWRWGLAVGLSQTIPLIFRDSGFTLWPLGLLAFGILSLPLIGASVLASWISRGSGS